MLNSIIGSEITVSSFLICTAVSLVLGMGTALVGMFGAKSSQNFAIAVAILPTVVQAVIMLVNGNIGAGVAVAGAFGLVRFRSAPGTAKEICAIFLAMAIGLATGMGYIGLAALLFVVAAAAIIILTKFDFGAKKHRSGRSKSLFPKILITTDFSTISLRNTQRIFHLKRSRPQTWVLFMTLRTAWFSKRHRCRNPSLTNSVVATVT